MRERAWMSANVDGRRKRLASYFLPWATRGRKARHGHTEPWGGPNVRSLRSHILWANAEWSERGCLQWQRSVGLTMPPRHAVDGGGAGSGRAVAHRRSGPAPPRCTHAASRRPTTPAPTARVSSALGGASAGTSLPDPPHETQSPQGRQRDDRQRECVPTFVPTLLRFLSLHVNPSLFITARLHAKHPTMNQPCNALTRYGSRPLNCLKSLLPLLLRKACTHLRTHFAPLGT